MSDFTEGIRSILEAVSAVKPGESALVLADDEGQSIWLGQIIRDVVGSMGAETVLAFITPPVTASQEPPPSVAAAMKSVNAIFRVSEKTALVHTKARRDATAAGARYYPFVQMPLDDLKFGASAADIRLIKERTEALSQRLTQAEVAKVTTPLGTDINLTLTGREGIALHPLNPFISGLHYYAEAAVAPVEGTAEGTAVFDVAAVDWGYVLREPLRCKVKAGKLADISGSQQDVDRLREIIATHANADNIAELGIGTSHIVPMPIYGIRRDVARVGTVHIGIGRNKDIGGAMASDVHMDILMDQATVELDGQCVLSEAKLHV